MPRPAHVDVNGAVMRDGGAVEQHLLDAHMIVEPLEVAQPRHSATDMTMHRRGAMGRQVDVMGFAQRSDLQETGDAAAACGVGLQNVDGVGLQHAARVVQGVSVFAGGDFDFARRAFAHQTQAR